jgi:tetratricopeptide (TPR) repeat protein
MSQTNASLPSSSHWPFKGSLVAEDAKKVENLNLKIDGLIEKGQFAEAADVVKQVLEVRQRVQGADHWETGDCRRSLQTLQRIAALTGAARSEWDKSTRMWKDAFTKAFQKNYGEAIPLLKQAMEIRRRLVGDENVFVSAMRSNLAFFYDLSDRRAEAEPLLREGLELDRHLRGEDHPETALSAIALANNLNGQGKYSDAEVMDRAALGIYRRLFGEDHPMTATGYHNVAFDLNLQGRLAEAEPLFHKALEIDLRTNPEEVDKHSLLYAHIAGNLGDQGKLTEAEALYRKALDVVIQSLGEDSRAAARRYESLARNLHAQCRYDEAEPLYHKAVDIRRRIKDRERLAPIGIRASLANLQKQKGRLAEAEQTYRQILTESQLALRESPPLLASLTGNLAVIVHAQGRHDEAERLLRAAIEIQRRVLGNENPNTIESMHNLGVVLWSRGEYREAEAALIEATRGHEAARLRAGAAGIDRTVAFGDRSPLALLATCAARAGRSSESWTYLERDLARGLFDDLAARHSRPLTTDEVRREQQLVGRLQRLDERIAALSAAGKLDEEARTRLADLQQQRLVSAGEFSELEQALSSRYGVAAGKSFELARIQSRIPEDTALIAWIDCPATLKAADPNGEHWAFLLRSRGAPICVKLRGTGPAQTWTESDQRLPGLVRENFSKRPVDPRSPWLSQVERLARQRLDPLAEKLDGRDKLPAVQHLIVLPSPAMAGVPIEALIRGWDKGPQSATVSYAPSGTVLTWIQEQKQKIDVAARRARPLRLLALAVSGFSVPTPPDVAAPPNGILIVETQPGSNAARHGIQRGDVLLSYGGSKITRADELRSLIETPVERGPSQEGAIPKPVSAVIWREGREVQLTLDPGPLGIVPDRRSMPRALEARNETLALLARSRSRPLEPLPGARREVQTIAALFDQRVELLLDAQASESQLDDLARSGRLRSFDILHLATHGEIDDRVAMHSRLHLWRDPRTDSLDRVLSGQEPFDDELTAEQILRTWKLDAELVTLSACETGLGRASGGEGYLGFSQALFLAGARSLLLSLWKVDDEATALLMRRFYENLLGKRDDLKRPMPKAGALDEAKRWLRQLTSDQIASELAGLTTRGGLRISLKGKPAALPTRFDHPYYWAGFVLIGDPN